MKGVQECPTPSKRAFRSAEAADDRIETARGMGGDDLESYECPCGEWHLRNRSRYEGKNAFHAKQRQRRASLIMRRARERAALGLDLDEVADAIMAAMGLSEVTESAPKEVTDE